MNVSQTQPLREAFATLPKTEIPISFQLAQTRRVRGTTDRLGITPCPEAVHQIRIFDNAGSYLGRVGFNVHQEAENPVVTIAIIQGVPDKGPVYDQLRNRAGIDPFETAIQVTRDLVQSILPEANFRAVIPPKAKRPDFYERILDAVGIHIAKID